MHASAPLRPSSAVPVLALTSAPLPEHDPVRSPSPERAGGEPPDRGQATAEYALVLLGAAAIAVLLVAWATSGGGAGKIGQLLDKVLDAISSRVG